MHRFLSVRVRNEGNAKRTATARDTSISRRVGMRRRESWSKVVVEEGERFVPAVGDGCGRSRAQNGRPWVALATESGGAGTSAGGGAFESGGGHY